MRNSRSYASDWSWLLEVAIPGACFLLLLLLRESIAELFKLERTFKIHGVQPLTHHCQVTKELCPSGPPTSPTGMRTPLLPWAACSRAGQPFQRRHFWKFMQLNVEVECFFILASIKHYPGIFQLSAIGQIMFSRGGLSFEEIKNSLF